MSNKHYDINYLHNTRRLLKDLKESSYNLFGKIDSGTVIDLGCGGGKDVLELASLLGNEVELVGVDHDPLMIGEAQKAAEGTSNAKFVLSEVYSLPFENDSVMGLRTERVIQHLLYPDKGIEEIKRILKKDQPLVIIETDWHSLSFYTEFVETEKKINSYLTDVKVNNGYAARKIVSYLQSASFRNIAFEIHPFVINSLEDANEYFWIEKIINEASDKQYITKEEQHDFYSSLQYSDDNKYFACSINLVLVSCIK